MSSGEIFDFDKPIETVVLDSTEYLHNAEVSMEDDLSMIDGIINNGKKEQLDEMSNLSNGILFTYEHEHSSGDQFWTDTAELLKKDDTFTYIKHDGWYGKDESVEVSVTEASALFHEAVEKSQSGNKDYTITAEAIQRQFAERPDVPLFLEEIDFSSCDDATLQTFRDSAKANMQCANEISQALAKNYDYERYTLNSEQALADVREKFSDDRIAFVLTSTLNGTSDGRIAKVNVPFLVSESCKSSATLVGCGLGVCDDTLKIVFSLIENSTTPLVLDADALNCVAKQPEILLKKKAPIIITPHPGEMSRLTGLATPLVNAERERVALDFAQKYGVVTVLKGAGTVIASPNGKVLVNPTGNSGMATGGSGDVLAGMTASILAQGASAFSSAAAAVYLHGLAGDIAAEKYGKISMLPTDLINCIPLAYKRCGFLI